HNVGRPIDSRMDNIGIEPRPILVPNLNVNRHLTIVIAPVGDNHELIARRAWDLCVLDDDISSWGSLPVDPICLSQQWKNVCPVIRLSEGRSHRIRICKNLPTGREANLHLAGMRHRQEPHLVKIVSVILELAHLEGNQPVFQDRPVSEKVTVVDEILSLMRRWKQIVVKYISSSIPFIDEWATVSTRGGRRRCRDNQCH